MARFPLHRYILAVALAGVIRPAAAALLYSTFQDHAVLQREVPIPVWGTTTAGATITVTLAKNTGAVSSTTARATAQAGPDGRWQATLPALPAGGPYTLSAASSSGARDKAGDILIGDVFLCSGQSNMEYPTRLASDYDQDVDNANNGLIRLFHVDRFRSVVPRTTFGAGARWEVTSPLSVREFAAVCYFFGRDLQPAVAVPIGLIESAWGGSVIQAWISEPRLRRLGGYDRYLDLLPVYARSPAEAARDWDRITAGWWRAHDPASAARPPWYAPAYDDSSWHSIVPSGTWRAWNKPDLLTFNGLVWLRKDVVLDARQAGQAAVLSLGPIDQSDIAWVDGLEVGALEGYDVPRTYDVPAGVLRAGHNTIAVGVLGGAGPLVPGSQMTLKLADGTVVRLSGKWRYKTSIPMTGRIPSVPWLNQFGLTVLHNGMIAPLGATRIRGILWYQGESNADTPREYARLLPALIADWRQQFGQSTPVLLVQLPGFGPYRTQPQPSSWARLREVERRVAAATPHAGLAVTIDVGSPRFLHPTDKQDVGQRLALLARSLIYGESVVGVSPSPVGAWRSGAKVQVRFDAHGGGLVTEESNRPIGFQLCDRDGHCAFVDAEQRGTDIVLDASSTPAAVTVRYCWSDTPMCNLYDQEGLPAVPFELPIGRTLTSLDLPHARPEAP
ncbi:MAG TPA: sialate O-acetylesterase [Steroidobacteraceae bacterium]|jgi:sialate O-acetylesterase|nr:sialate O-acetylesterase [Steroidobacteraceae bacterium]